MNIKTQSLAERREMLIQRCRLQRQQLAAQRLAMRQSFGVGQLASNVTRFARSNPLPLAGIAIAFFVLRPRRFVSLAVSAATLFKTWQRLSPVLYPLYQRLFK